MNGAEDLLGGLSTWYSWKDHAVNTPEVKLTTPALRHTQQLYTRLGIVNGKRGGRKRHADCSTRQDRSRR
jgi:hypothetical protein